MEIDDLFVKAQLLDLVKQYRPTFDKHMLLIKSLKRQIKRHYDYLHTIAS